MFSEQLASVNLMSTMHSYQFNIKMNSFSLILLHSAKAKFQTKVLFTGTAIFI
jgi:hypothetical protein